MLIYISIESKLIWIMHGFVQLIHGDSQQAVQLKTDDREWTNVTRWSLFWNFPWKGLLFHCSLRNSHIILRTTTQQKIKRSKVTYSIKYCRPSSTCHFLQVTHIKKTHKGLVLTNHITIMLMIYGQGCKLINNYIRLHCAPLIFLDFCTEVMKGNRLANTQVVSMLNRFSKVHEILTYKIVRDICMDASNIL